MINLFRPGPDKPTLNQSFLGSSLPTGWTLTRGSAATYFTSAGALASASTNTARFDYDPSTSVINGLLIEAAGTNLCLRSEAFDNAAWIQTGISSVTANAIAAPDGATTADKLVEDSANSQHLVTQTSLSVTSGTAYSFSAFLKAAERTAMFLRYGNANMPNTGRFFNLSTGATADDIGGAPAGGSFINSGGAGFYRAGIAETATGTGTLDAIVGLANGSTTGSNSYTGNGSNGAYPWGAQIEANPYPTSYIGPTAGTSGSRSADVVTMTRTGVSKGGVIVRARTPAGAGTQVLWQWDDGSENNRLTIYRASDNTIHAVVRASSSTSVDITLAAVAANTNFAVGLAWEANNVSAVLNAGAVTNDTSATIPTGLTTMRLGASSSATSWNGHVRGLATFEGHRPSDARIQSMTGA